MHTTITDMDRSAGYIANQSNADAAYRPGQYTAARTAEPVLWGSDRNRVAGSPRVRLSVGVSDRNGVAYSNGMHQLAPSVRAWDYIPA